MFTFGIIGMAMQEDQTVTFNPEFVDGPLPWIDRLFALYLLFAIINTVVRAIALLWALRKHRKTQSQGAPLVAGLSTFWETCNARTRSMRNFSHLTFLLSVLVFAMNAIDAMEAVATQKTAGAGAIAGATAGAFTTFSAGMVVCIALFCCAMFLERLVQRQKRRIDKIEIKFQTPLG